MSTWGTIPAGVLAALAVVAAQVPYGGLLYPVLAAPGFAILGVAAVLGLLPTALGPRPQAWPPAIFLGLLFSGWMLWRAVSAPPCAEVDGWVRLILACAVMFFLFAGALGGSQARMAFFAVLIVAALVQATLGAYQFLRNPTEMPIPWLSEQLRLWYETPLLGNKRAHGFFINGIHLAWFLNLASLAALAVGCWSKWPAWARVCAIYVAAVGFAVGLATLSRGGVVGLTSGLGVFLFASGIAFAVGGRGRRMAVLLTVSMGVLVAAGSATLVFSESFLVQSRMAILLDDTYRPLVTQATLRQFQLDPLLGGGPGSFKALSRGYRAFAAPSDDMFAHNDWAQVASDFGYPAFALLLLLVLALAACGLRGLALAARYAGAGGHAAGNSVAVHIACLAGLAASAMHALFDFSMQIPANALLTSALAGMLANPGQPLGSGPWSHRASQAAGCTAAIASGLGGLALLALLALQAPRESTYLQAENQLLSGNPEAAVHMASRELEKNPSNYDFRVLRARALIEATGARATRAERSQASLGAAIDLRAAAQVRPLDPFLEVSLGMVEGRLGNFHAAEQAGARAIALFPLYAGGYEVLAMALEAQERIDEALGIYATGSRLPNSQRLREKVKFLRRQANP